MSNIEGKVILQKRNAETMELTYGYEQDNTQMIGMYSNLFEEDGSRASMAAGFTYSNNQYPFIYISDGTNVLNRFSGTVISTDQTYQTTGTIITGEYWPQYGQYREEGYEVFTFKKRFSPPPTTRTIHTIAYYNNWVTSLPGSSYMAAMKLQTPCIQTSTEILDIYYKIYVYYPSGDKLNDPRLNQNFLIQRGQLWRWFAYTWNQTTIYWEGTSTPILPNFGGTGGTILGTTFLNTPADINGRDTDFSNAGYSTTTNTTNRTQGTTRKTYNFALNASIGGLYSHMGVMVMDYPNTYNGHARNIIATAPIYSDDDPYIQSVYLKNAISDTTNFAYLDPSTIGTSTAQLTFNDRDWNKQNRSQIFNLRLVDGGDINTASYTIEVSECFGFASNFFSSENYWYPRGGIDYYDGAVLPDAYRPHINNTYRGTARSIKRVDDENVLSMSSTGISITNMFTGNYVNYDSTSTPALNSSQIQDSVVAPDGTIYIATTDVGLLKLNPERTAITAYAGIGSGVTDNICYTLDVKDNGDVWAMFEGGLCKLTVSTQTWEVYNSSTPITFPSSEYNPTWNNTLKISCRKDAGTDMLLLSRINSGNLTWWSPDSPTPVNTTGNFQIMKNASSNIRADFHSLMKNVPGTDKWFIWNNQRYVITAAFGTNSYTIADSRTDNFYFPHLKPVFFNNAWNMQVIRTWYQNYSCNIHDEFGAIVDSFTTAVGHNNQYESVVEILNERGTALMQRTGSDYYTNIRGLPLFNILPVSHPRRWLKYGWDSVNSEWSLNETSPKPVHTSMDDLFDGIKVSFTPTGGPNDFIAGERWTGYVFRGLHKDNSTEAATTYAQHIRDSNTTTDLTVNIIPSSLGPTTEDFNLYTLESEVYSYGGGVSACYANTSSVANGIDSELILDGDFNISFNTQQFASTTSTANSTSYFSLHDTSLPRASNYAFRLRSDGWVVAENDVALTSPVSLGPDDLFSIRRVGNTITYYVNDSLVHTSSTTTTEPLRGLIRMPSNDTARTYFNMKVVYNETRPAIKIGNLLNQTGIYDPRYAMIEAWLTDPHTTKVTIDGNNADIITNPLIAPESGQVLLLQKSGLLVFHPDDIGKPVTCDALVLLET